MEVVQDKSSLHTLHICFFCCVLFSLALGNLALGQSTAVLKGTVTDALGAAIPHAKVVAKNQVTGAKWNTESNNWAGYRVPALPMGLYQFTVAATGFETSVVPIITLNAATPVTQTAKLQNRKT